MPTQPPNIWNRSRKRSYISSSTTRTYLAHCLRSTSLTHLPFPPNRHAATQRSRTASSTLAKRGGQNAQPSLRSHVLYRQGSRWRAQSQGMDRQTAFWPARRRVQGGRQHHEVGAKRAGVDVREMEDDEGSGGVRVNCRDQTSRR